VQILNEIKSVRSLRINTFLVLQMSIEHARSSSYSVSVRLMLSMINGQCHFARTSETSVTNCTYKNSKWSIERARCT